MVFPIKATPEGGYGMEAARLGNALQQQILENKMKELENQFYAPKTQSEIDYKNAVTTGQNIDNQFSPERNRLDNQHSGLVNQLYAPNILSEISNRNASTNKMNVMTPLEAKELEQKNALYPDLTRAQINNYNALSSLRQMGGGMMGVGGKELMQFQYQLRKDHPDWDENMLNQASSGYLSGDNILPNGQPLPPLSGVAQVQASQIANRTGGRQLQNQAASMANTTNELKSIDINPVKEFAGLSGKAKYLYQKANPSKRTDSWRDYDSFRNVTSVLVMDTLRNSLKTSVIPGYVNATIGKFSNPNDEMWDDPAQVQKKWDTLINWVDKNKENTIKQAKQGATVPLSGEKNKSSSAVGSSSDAKPTLKFNSSTGEFEEIK